MQKIIEQFEFDSESLVELVPELAGLNNKLPPEISGGDDPFLACSPEKISELRGQVQELLRAQLLRHGEPQ